MEKENHRRSRQTLCTSHGGNRKNYTLENIDTFGCCLTNNDRFAGGLMGFDEKIV